MLKPAFMLSNRRLERRFWRYVNAGLPVPLDVQGEMIRRGYRIVNKERK